MNILFYSTVYPHPTASVRGTFNWELCHALARRAGVRVVTPRTWIDVTCSLGKARVDLASTLPTEWPCFVYPVKFLKHTYGQWMWHCTKSSLRRLQRGFDAEWVVSYWAHPDGEVGTRAAREFGAKSAVIVGGSDVLLLPRDPRRKRCVADVLIQADAVITVSEGLREPVINLGVDPARVHCVYQGVDCKHFRQGGQSAARQRLGLPTEEVNAPPIFLWVGRMVELKRLDLIVRAFAAVRDVERDALLCLCGAGPQEHATRELVSSLGLNDSVIFAGPVAHSELPTWYQAADATVMASRSEGLPNVLRESLACGTPFVSTNVGSISEIAEPTHSVLVRTNDEAELKRGMLDILDPIFTSSAKQYVPQSWDDSAQKLLSVLQAVDAGTESPRPAANRNAMVSHG